MQKVDPKTVRLAWNTWRETTAVNCDKNEPV